MGIYIKGMEMPAHGIVINIYADGRVSNHYDENCKQIATATAVPPHGDLIDRDALPWEKQGLMLTDPDEWGLKAWDIEHAPAIIPAEEGE